MPPTTNRRVRSANLDDDRNRSVSDRRESIVEGDSDSLMSGGGSEDEDDNEDEDEGEGENRENGNENRTSLIFKGEFIMPPYEHAKRQLSQLYGMFHPGKITQEPMLKRGRTHERPIPRSCTSLPARRGMVA